MNGWFLINLYITGRIVKKNMYKLISNTNYAKLISNENYQKILYSKLDTLYNIIYYIILALVLKFKLNK